MYLISMLLFLTMAHPEVFWRIDLDCSGSPENPPFVPVALSRLSYTLSMIVQELISTFDTVSVVLEQISYAFCSSRLMPDLL